RAWVPRRVDTALRIRNRGNAALLRPTAVARTTFDPWSVPGGADMNMEQRSEKPSTCARCSGCFLPDLDGDLFCLMCGRPDRVRTVVLNHAVPLELEGARIG